MEAKTLKKKGKEPETAIKKIETFLKKEKIVGEEFAIYEIIIFSDRGATFLGTLSRTDLIGHLELQKQYLVGHMIEQGKQIKQEQETPSPTYVR